MIILLVLLPVLIHSTTSLIDWTKCGPLEHRCYCPDTTPELAILQKVADAARCAKVGLQAKFLDESVALFQMQVIGADTSAIGDNPDMKVYLGSELIFGCKFENGKAKLIGDLGKKFSISLFEDRSVFKKGEIAHCAVLSKDAVKFAKYMKPKAHETTKMTLENKGQNPIEYVFNSAHIDFFKPQDNPKSIKCNPYSFRILDFSQKYKVLPLVKMDEMTLNCDNYGPLYTMRYEHTTSLEQGDMNALECVETTGTNTWNIVKGDTQEPIIEPELYIFYCAANIERVCADPTVGCTQTAAASCPVFASGLPNTLDKPDGAPSAITCPDKKWLIDGEYHTLLSDPACEIDPGKENSAKFYARLPSGVTKEIMPEARCFTNFDCKLKSHLSLPQDDDVNSLADDSNGVLQCNNETRILTIVHSASNVTMNDSSAYQCDPTDGKWKNGTQIVPINSRVRCKEVITAPFREKLVANMTENQVYITIGACLAGLLVLLAILGVIFHCIRKNKYNIAMKMSTNMKKMDRTKLIANCKEEFGKMLLATPSDAEIIIHGLNKISMLLHEEVDDPEVWEEARKFLMRFHGTIKKTDMPIWNMFSRYLYLESKKIIDKHGWTSATEIRNKKRDGLMRAVALLLLSFSYDNYASPESSQMVFAAFRELGWKGISQYPHAGVAWSLIYHMRPPTFENTANKTRMAFDGEKLIKTLHDIMSSKVETYMPSKAVIPSFGSVARQAAFALGSCPNFRYLKEEAKNIIKNTEKHDRGRVPLSFFEGICLSPYRNPVCPLLEFFGMVDGRDDALLTSMNAVMVEEEWQRVVQEAVRVATYYGRHLDVKMIYERYMPVPGGNERAISKAANANVDFVKMQMEQKLFEAAVEKDKEDIRAWFAARTDIAEYKQRPDYSANPKGDHFVGEFNPLKDGCGDKFDSKSDSKSDVVKSVKSNAKSAGGTKSSDTKSSDNAKPPEPKEAAATPATTDPAATPVVSAAPATPHA